MDEVEIKELSHDVGERINGKSYCADDLPMEFTGDYALKSSAPATRRLP